MELFLKFISACMPTNILATGYKILAGIISILILALIVYFTFNHYMAKHDAVVAANTAKLYDQKIADANTQHTADLAEITFANKQVELMKTTLDNNTVIANATKATVVANNVKLVATNKALHDKLAQIQSDPTLTVQQKDDTMAASLIDDINTQQCDITTTCGVPNEKTS